MPRIRRLQFVGATRPVYTHVPTHIDVTQRHFPPCPDFHSIIYTLHRCYNLAHSQLGTRHLPTLIFSYSPHLHLHPLQPSPSSTLPNNHHQFPTQRQKERSSRSPWLLAVMFIPDGKSARSATLSHASSRLSPTVR